jgi:hypothetical protein
MAHLPDTQNPSYGLGIASLVLGTVGLLLFLLPVLGIPLGAVGLLLGLVGLVVAILGGPSSLRWSVAGIAMCLLALAAETAIVLAPAGYVPGRAEPRSWQAVAEPHYVSPPARPGRD